MSFWIPYYGTGVMDTDDYVVRSHWCPWLGIGRNEPRKAGLDWTNYHRKVAQWRRAADLFLGVYWPLTAYSLDNRAWMAWQFGRPDRGEGVIQAFRRGESPYESARFQLRGLQPAAAYTLTDIDTNRTTQFTGRELLDKGVLLSIANRPGSQVVFYNKNR